MGSRPPAGLVKDTAGPNVGSRPSVGSFGSLECGKIFCTLLHLTLGNYYKIVL